jgi:prepilin peptidase CpaA
MFLDICLLGILLPAVFYDLKERRIPNWLIISGWVLASIYYINLNGSCGLLFSVKGFITGILLLIIPFVMGGIGAGDVKLLGLIGAFKGSSFAFGTFLAMALWGGLMAIIILMLNHQLKTTLQGLGSAVMLTLLRVDKFSNAVPKAELSKTYPYGLAIFLGVLTIYFKGWCW